MTEAAEREQTRQEYESVLTRWEAEAFVQPGWSITWNEGDGAWTMEFQVGKKIYVLPEAAMDYYIVGASDREAHQDEGLKKARARLARIAEAHTKNVGAGGMTDGTCIECGEPDPCPTHVWATTERNPLATWDPADDQGDQ
jgi:hypothetical protein